MPSPLQELHNNSNASVSSYETAWSSSFSNRRSLDKSNRFDPKQIKSEPDSEVDENMSILENNISMMSVSSPASVPERKGTAGSAPMTPGDRVLQRLKEEPDQMLFRSLYPEMFADSSQPPPKNPEKTEKVETESITEEWDDFKENIPPWQEIENEKKPETRKNKVERDRPKKIQVSSDSENDDEAFNEYLKKLRQEPSQPEDVRRKTKSSTKFLVDDDYISEESSDEKSDGSESFEEDTSEEELDVPTSRDKTEKFKKSRPSDDEEWFLVSLTENFAGPIHEDAKVYIKENALRFKKNRETLLSRLEEILTRRIFSSIPRDKLKVIWNARLRKSAGQCRNHSNGNSTVEMSPVVCTTPERVRDTLIHELCHAAVWVVDRLHKEGHGPGWKKWGSRCSATFKSLPFVERCHSYEIEAKFFYVCENDGCDVEIKRQSKSLDTSRKACGKCLGRFILYRYCRRTNSRVRIEDPKAKETVPKSVESSQPSSSSCKGVNYDQFKEFSKDRYWDLTEEGLSHSQAMDKLRSEFEELTKN